MAEWFVVKVKSPSLVESAIANLARQNFRTAYPTFAARGRTKDRYPLFPSYLFVALDLDVDPWQKIHSTIGVAYVLPRHCEWPLALPQGFVEDLMQASERGDFDDAAEEVMARYSPGELLRLKTGPLAGQTGKFVRTRRGSIEILLALLGRDTTVTAPAQLVERVETHQRAELSARLIV